MKISVSFLKTCYDFNKTIDLLENLNIDSIHVDVIDGLFASSKTSFNKDMFNRLKVSKKPLDVHLMTLYLNDYIDVFATLKPRYIIFEYESSVNPLEVINYIKNKNIKVGLAISPLTRVDDIKPFLNLVDMVLVMSVVPGYGGQSFMPSTTQKIEKLAKLKETNNYNFLINVDGGVNASSTGFLKKEKLDMVVVGSYITNSMDFQKALTEIENNLK